MIQLLGSRTSPFVRRVRVVAHELGVAIEFLDSTTEAGQALVRDWSPIRKIPVARFGDEVVLDSHTIISRLLAEHGGPLRDGENAWETRVRHDVRRLDPEMLPPHREWNRAQFAERFLRAICNDRRKNLTYSKGNPKVMLHQSFLEQLRLRLTETQHVGSLQQFIDAFS